MHLLALQKRRGGMAKSPTAIAAKFGSCGPESVDLELCEELTTPRAPARTLCEDPPAMT